ncbi:MAG: T9SS type A sorting domain-containing protein [Bacteroidota bacterium]|nr:T9SS type A sorting domain-containing protein [Bacteroidota bacterium]
MKKNILLCLFVALSFYSQSQCTPVFYDGFESGNYTPTWTLGAGLTSATVSTGNTYAGNYKIEGFGGTSAHLTGLSTAFASATPNYMSWAIYPTGALATNYVVAGDNAVSATNCMMFCYWQGGTNIRFVSSTTQIYNCTPNAWYFIELKNINYVTHVFDIYINNVLIVASFPFRSNTVNNLSRVHLYNFNSGTGTWDDVKVGNGFSASALTNSISCFGGSNGSSTVSVNGSNGPFTYTWTAPAVSTSSIASSLTAGNYTCTVSNGTCIASTSLNIIQPAVISAVSTQSNALCFNACNATASVSASGGTGVYTYSWIPSGGTASSEINLCAGNYTCLVTDANSCVQTNTISITQPTQISAVVSQTNITCVNSSGSASITTSGGVGPYTYSWSPSGGTAPSASSLTATNYTCTTLDANLCPIISTVAILSNTTSPVVTVPGTSVICTGQTATLSASGANSYTWSTSANTSSIVISPTLTTTYTVSGTNTTNGCVGTTTVVQNVSLCTGIESIASNSSNTLQVYPNPSNGEFNISFSEKGIYYLINALGQTIKEIKIVDLNNSTIEVANLPTGVYFIIGNRTKAKIIVSK